MNDASIEDKARHQRWLHFSLAVVWALLLIPTLIWWKESILWVLIISLYANVASHWSAFQASKAEEHANGDT
jgi:hypothetical protein